MDLVQLLFAPHYEVRFLTRLRTLTALLVAGYFMLFDNFRLVLLREIPDRNADDLVTKFTALLRVAGTPWYAFW